MSLGKFSPPPSATPMTLPSGVVSPAWQQWFQLVSNALSFGTSLVQVSFSPGNLTNNVTTPVGSVTLANSGALYEVNISVVLTLTAATFTELTVQLSGAFTGNFFFSSPTTTATVIQSYSVGPLYIAVPVNTSLKLNVALIAAFSAGTVIPVVEVYAIQIA